MKKILLLTILTVIILTGCKSKSTFSVTFDEFTIRIYDNDKQYIALSPNTSNGGMKILTEMKEKTIEKDTGFINSLVIGRTTIQSGINIKDLVDSNTKNLQLKLLKYSAIDNESKKVKCDDLQYSGYITAFSYQLDKETLYGGQYFFTDDEALYLLSLSSDKEKDITSFIKSIETVKCIQ